MSAELEVDFGITGQVVYFLVRSAVGTIWNGGSLVAYVSGNYSTYPVAGTEQGSSGFYTGNMPAVAAGTYNVIAKQRIGGSPAESDPTIGVGTVQWDGANVPGFPPNFAALGIDTSGDVTIGAAGLNLVLPDGTHTLPAMVNYACAALFGISHGAGSGTETYAAPAGAHNFVVSFDGSSNRVSVTLN